MAPRKATGGIPASVTASRAIARGACFSGAVPLAQFSRLAPLLADAGGELQVELELSRDGAGDWLKGILRGELQLQCQRGLHPFPWACEVPVSLRLVHSEAEEQRVLEEADPWLVQDDSLPLRDIVEDEVLLALPMLARCPDDDCIERFLK